MRQKESEKRQKDETEAKGYKSDREGIDRETRHKEKEKRQDAEAQREAEETDK